MSLKVSDLDFDYPEEQVALQPTGDSRVLWTSGGLSEITVPELLAKISAGDVVIINNTQVLKRRIFAAGSEILFLNEQAPGLWQVLMPSKNLKIGDQLQLPGEVRATLHIKGLPQVLRIESAIESVLDEAYFAKYGELPLPPYIQKARGDRHNQVADENWYQTAWASQPGSLAAPTASFHLSQQDIAGLQHRGVKVAEVTLHVGLGTFLPIHSENLSEHKMHAEKVEIAESTWRTIQDAKQRGGKIWAVGTTVARSLESAAHGRLTWQDGWRGETDLMIVPGFEWQIVDYLLTNFHQPRSTLLALVAAFAGLEYVLEAYAWAVQRKFRLFSYGDLSVWQR